MNQVLETSEKESITRRTWVGALGEIIATIILLPLLAGALILLCSVALTGVILLGKYVGQLTEFFCKALGIL